MTGPTTAEPPEHTAGMRGWANRLTVARGGLALALWALLGIIGAGHQDRAGLWWAAFAIFVVAAVTDTLDGGVARRYGDVSVFGRIADPLVDKMLILGSIVFLVAIPGIPSVFPAWVAAVILARDLLVTALRSAVEAAGGNFQAGPWGKAKMIVQCCAVGAVLLHGAGVQFLHTKVPALTGASAAPDEWTWPLVLSIFAGVVTAISGVEYVIRGVAALNASAKDRS